jgi:hypoxanthine phosphoribosyltransferase
MMSDRFPDERIDRILLTPEQIATRVGELGRQISSDYAGRDLVLVTVLKGGLFFMADLSRSIDMLHTLDFMAVSSYGLHAGGGVRIVKDLDEDIEGRDVLMVEDIIDTGLTLHYLLRVLRERKPASLAVCTLLDKDVRRIVDLPIEYHGFSVPDRFLVGYGLDLGGVLRNLAYVATLHDEVFEG